LFRISSFGIRILQIAAMSRNFHLWLLITVLLLTFSSAEAQLSKKVYRIGYLANAAGMAPREQAFRRGLRELGYVEGQNLVIEWRFSKGKLDLLQNLASDLVRLKVDLILAIGVAPTRAAKEATGTIPIVMGNADDDPVRLGLVASLARPGGNVTGFTNIGSALAGKRLELQGDCSKTRLAWPFSGTQRVKAARGTLERPRLLRLHWACSFSPWKYKAPKTWRMLSTPQSKAAQKLSLQCILA
jgi:hypothetical protein